MPPDPETELRGDEYIATPEGLQIIDAAMASIDADEGVPAPDIKVLFAKYRQT
jgi:hypothetical protein